MNTKDLKAARLAATQAMEHANDVRGALLDELDALRRLAHATVDLLDLIRGEFCSGSTATVNDARLFEQKDKLEPLANSLGFTIRESDLIKNHAIIEELP